MIFKHRTDLLRYMVRMVGTGYVFWTSGHVKVGMKAKSLAFKFADRYDVHLDKFKRSRRKAKGEANTHLLMLPAIVDEEKRLLWWLFVSEGEGAVHELERLKDARKAKERVSFGDYELVKTPRKKHPDYPDKPAQAAWNWRYTNECMKGLEVYSIALVRKHQNREIRDFIDHLNRTFGFHDSRQQAFGLFSEMQKEWRRRWQDEAWPFDEKLVMPWYGRWQSPTLLEHDDLRLKRGWNSAIRL